MVTSIHGVELGTRAGLTFSGHGADAEQRDLQRPWLRIAAERLIGPTPRRRRDYRAATTATDVVTLLDTVNLARAIPMMSSMPMSGRGTSGSQPSE